MSQETDVLVIGGGVIGICSAHYLAEHGVRVTVVDMGEVCAGASYGNAGLLVPSHSIPLPSPGVLTQGLKWLLDPVSPFYVKPRLDFAFLTWLWKFYRSCNRRWLHIAMPVIHELGSRGLALYKELIGKEHIDCSYNQKGWLHLFKTKHGFEKGIAEAKIVSEIGVKWQALTMEDVLEMEPNVSPSLAGGLYYPEDASLDPAAFVKGLASVLKQQGVNIRTSCKVLGIRNSASGLCCVETTQGDIRAREVVLAGGAWSPVIAKGLGLRLPIQAAKGYSITFEHSFNAATVPLMFSEARVALTPFKGNRLRLAGTLELTGLDMSISQARVDAIRTSAREYLTGLDEVSDIEVWQGSRPCTPDGLPLIGRTKNHPNLIVASGHGMLGVTQGTITGRLVTQIICEEEPDLDLSLLSPDRF